MVVLVVGNDGDGDGVVVGLWTKKDTRIGAGGTRALSFG